jgi:hypothetical protein
VAAAGVDDTDWTGPPGCAGAGSGDLLGQSRGGGLTLDEMSAGHLAAVAGMLRRQATMLHSWALVEAVYAIRDSARLGVPCGDELEFALTGASIADATASEFVEGTTLMRAITRLLAGSV